MTRALLVEREEELARLAAATRAAADGDGRLVVLEGPAGIGKSRLLREHARRVREDGLRLLTARGGELERDVPNGVVRQLFERAVMEAGEDARSRLLSGAAELAAPAVAHVPAAAAPATGSGVLHGLYWLCANLAADAPLVLHVDDLQWADQPSLRFVDYLLRRLEGLPVTVVCAVRTGEEAADDPLVARVLTDPAAEDLRPAPLGVDGVAAVIADATGSVPDDAFAAAAHAASGGNPFLLRELVAALRADGVEPVAGEADRVRELGPRTVGRAVLLRLASVAPEAIGLARAAAILGEGSTLEEAAALTGMDATAAAQASDALVHLDVLEDARRLAFVHPIVRAAIHQDLAPSHRAELHARAAVVLRERGAPADRIATHLAGAAPAGEAWRVGVLRGAAAEAYAGGANEAAMGWLRRALEEPPEAADLGQVLLALGRVEASAADAAAAAAHLEAAREHLGVVERAAVYPDLGWVLLGLRGIPAVAELLLEEIAAIEPLDADVALKLEAILAAIGSLSPEVAPVVAERVRRHRDVPGAGSGERLVLASVAQLAWYGCEPADEVVRLATAAFGDGALLADGSIEDLPAYQVAYALAMADASDRALAAAEQIVTAGRRRGSAIAFGAGSGVRAFAHLRAGDLAAAEADGQQSFEGLRQLGPLEHQQPMSFVAVRALVEALVERDDLPGAERALRDSGFDGDVFDLVPLNRVLLARAALRLAQHRPAEALVDLELFGERDARAGVEAPPDGWRVLLAAALRQQGGEHRARAFGLLDEHLAAAERWGRPGPRAEALRERALWETGDARLDGLQAAAALAEDVPSKMLLAHVLGDLGASLRAGGRRREAQDVLGRALDLALGCGGLALARRVHADLAAVGAKPRRLAFSGADDLTASERRVADMAAAGLSNKAIAQELFVTAKTVENQLGRVYVKLGISSRRDLATHL